MKTLLNFFFLLLSLNTVSQTNKVLIKISPLPLIDEVSFPTIQAGVEFTLSDKMSWYNEVGVKYRKSYYEYSDTSFLASNGFKIKSEVRYYFRQNSSTFSGRYVAANAFFIYDIHNAVTSYFYQKDSSMEKIDNFGVKKNVFGINLVYGFQRSLSERFLFELFAGVGIRFRTVNTINKEYDKNRDNISGTPVDVTISGIRNEIDANNSSGFISTHAAANSSDPVTPNITFGIRFSYRL
jgi:hypothetical protein